MTVAKHPRLFRPVLAFAALLCLQAIARAQMATPPAYAASSEAIFVSRVDREDLVDLATASPAGADVVKGLFPEDMESPEKRKVREQCEGVLRAGYMCMPPARSYTRFSLPGATFAVGSAALPDSMKTQLRSFADVLKGRQSKAPAVRIDGHADATGSKEANMALSQRRAESVRDYLVSLGVSPGLLAVQGFGSANLRNAQDPAAGENRRVEIARKLELK